MRTGQKCFRSVTASWATPGKQQAVRCCPLETTHTPILNMPGALLPVGIGFEAKQAGGIQGQMIAAEQWLSFLQASWPIDPNLGLAPRLQLMSPLNRLGIETPPSTGSGSAKVTR